MTEVELSETKKAVTGPKFQFIAGALCLDFCNTVAGNRETIPREKLNSIEDFIAWSEQAQLMDHAEAERLRHDGNSRADEVLARAVRLREAIYRIFRAASKGKTPEPADMATLNAELEASLGRLRVAKVKGEKGFQWRWGDDDARLENTLGPIARSAAELLTHEDALKQVEQLLGKSRFTSESDVPLSALAHVVLRP